MEKWEYISIKFDTKGFFGGVLDIDHFDAQLNKLGEQGWELVSCFSTNEVNGKNKEVTAVFKRRK